MAKINEPSAKLPKGHAERHQFPKLIATNPNYFGNFPGTQFQPVFPLANDTTYEQLTCVGYNPDRKILEAVVQIKQPTGYLGDECTSGSYEYVRFFVDTGSGLANVGLAAINVHDIPNGTDCADAGEKPLTYSVSVDYDPSNAEDCDDPALAKVRAILSWQTIPPATNPNYSPTWGDHHDCNIQLAPGPETIQDIIEDFIEEGVKIPGLLEKYKAIAQVPIPSPDPGPLSLAQVAKLYSAKEAGKHHVPAHRFHRASSQQRGGGCQHQSVRRA
jgi:hypothetical protein